jgi:hypothetical protein
MGGMIETITAQYSLSTFLNFTIVPIGAGLIMIPFSLMKNNAWCKVVLGIILVVRS